MDVKKRLLACLMAVGLLTTAIGFQQVYAASINQFTLDVVEDVIGLEVTVTSPEGTYLGKLSSVETNGSVIKRTLNVKNIGNVDLKVTGYADPVLKDDKVYNKQKDFDIQYNYSGLKYSSIKDGYDIGNAKVLNSRLEKTKSYDSSLDFNILNQVDVGQYKFSFYHIGEYVGK